MKPLYTTCCFLFLLAASVPSFSQGGAVPYTTTNAAGGTYDNPSSYFRFEWSLGELMMVQTLCPTDSSLFVTQGVLQPLVEKALLSPQLLVFTKGDYSLFPNPTDGRFEVNFTVRQSGRMTLQLTDIMGKVLVSRSFRYYGWGHIEQYDLSRYNNGTYFVIATLVPDAVRPGDFSEVIRHSGFKVIKVR